MTHAERLAMGNWKAVVEEDFPVEIIGFSCPVCKKGIRLFKKTDALGRDIYKQACVSCDFETAFLKKKDALQKRTASSQGKWAKVVMTNGSYRCFVCGSKDALQAHHIVPVYADKAKMNDVSNGIVLCEDCHKKAHMARFAKQEVSE